VISEFFSQSFHFEPGRDMHPEREIIVVADGMLSSPGGCWFLDQVGVPTPRRRPPVKAPVPTHPSHSPTPGRKRGLNRRSYGVPTFWSSSITGVRLLRINRRYTMRVARSSSVLRE